MREQLELLLPLPPASAPEAGTLRRATWIRHRKEPRHEHDAPAASAPRARIVVTNIESVPGRRIVEHYGLVAGSTVRAKHVGRDSMASLKNIVGGELKGYTELLSEARAEATERMLAQAAALGANAIVSVRCSTSSVAQGASEPCAHGTAVRVEDAP